MKERSTRHPGSGERSTVYGTRGAVASCEHPVATFAGIRLLENGVRAYESDSRKDVGTLDQ